METEKMKIFQMAKKNLASMDLDANKRPFHRMQVLHLIQSFVAITLQCLYIVFEANTAREYMDSIYMITVGVFVYTGYWSIIFKTTTIFEFIDHFETIVNERLKYPRSKALYERTNELTEIGCKIIHIFLVYVVVPGFVLPMATYSYFLYFSTNLGSDAFKLPFPTWFPFDWKNPVGYSIAVLLQLRIASIPIRFLDCFLSLGLASFIFALSFAKDLKDDARSINKNIRKKHKHDQFREQFTDFIRFINIKRLLSIFTEVYRNLFLLGFLGATAVILLALLMIQIDLNQADKDTDLLVMFESIALCIAALILVLVPCEAGQKFSDAFNEFDDVVGQINFYLLPMEFQRLLPTVVMYTQEPLVIRFFGSLSCSREQFKKVIKMVYQYFMVLREFYK